MKKFAGRLIFFFLFFMLFFILLNFIYLGILIITDWDFKKRIESLTFNKPDFELLVLGTSLPEYGIDTELLTLHGIKSYNLALIGNSDQTSYIQLNEYLTKYSKKPLYVLFCIDSQADPYNHGIQPVVDFSMKDAIYGLNDVPISKFRWYGVEFIKKILSSGHRKTKLSYGQIKSPRTHSDKTVFKELYLNKQIIESRQWIKEIVTLCSQNNIQVILIGMPGAREAQNLSEIGPYTLCFGDGCSAIMYNFGNQDFCTLIDSEKDWVGMSHLNEKGAAKFTNEILYIFSNQSINKE